MEERSKFAVRKDRRGATSDNKNSAWPFVLTCRAEIIESFCNRAINFWAKFRSDSDHSRRAFAPAFFSTLLVNSTNLCTLARTLRRSFDCQRHIFLQERRVHAEIHLNVSFLIENSVVKVGAVDQELHLRGLQESILHSRQQSKDPNTLQTCRRSLREADQRR